MSVSKKVGNMAVPALVMRHRVTNKLISVFLLSDGACECEYIQIDYPSDLVTTEELKDYLFANTANDEERRDMYKQYVEHGSFFLERKADDMPDIGNCVVQLETRELVWE